MTVASCPSCKESVTVPIGATPDSIVRCPFCHEEFQLEAFLTQLPPSLIVLDGRSAVGQQAASEQAAEPDTEQLDGEPDASSSNVLGAFVTTPETSDPGDSVPAFDFTPGSVEEDDEDATAPRRRRQKNPTVEVIKIIAGALLAIPAAQLILWWFVPGDWKRDLLGIGPAVSRVVPWAVPEKFHALDEDDIDIPLLQNDRNRGNSVRQRRARPRSNNGSAMPLPGSGNVGSKQTGQPKSMTKDSAIQDSATQDSATKDTPPAPAPPSKQQGPSQPEAKKTESRESIGLVRGVRGAPQSTQTELRAALETAVQASVAWDTDPDQSKKRRDELTEQFYEAFARLSEAVTYPPPNDPETRELVTSVNGMLSTFAKEPKKLAMIGNQTSDWLDRATRPNQGIFMFGTVGQIKSTGSLFETELELGAIKRRTITVISRIDPNQTFVSGDRILMLGAIVEQPQHNLLGYEGTEPMVVMGGFPVLLR